MASRRTWPLVEESTWHVAGELWGQAYVRDLRGGGSGELASVEGAACGGAASGVTIPRRENDLNNRPNSPALGGLPSAMFSLLKLSYCCTNSAYESCTSSPSVLHFSMSSTLNASSFPVADNDLSPHMSTQIVGRFGHMCELKSLNSRLLKSNFLALLERESKGQLVPNSRSSE